jgi:hypothetical protein
LAILASLALYDTTAINGFQRVREYNTQVPSREKYVKRASQFVVAVQLDLETDGFMYRKWGSIQTCKRGDWLVYNNGDIYTVDGETFARTYRPTGPGTYVKVSSVWAEVAAEAGEVRTKEGSTHYESGDYLVYNEPDGGDAYAVSKSAFEQMYERQEALKAPAEQDENSGS